MTSHPLDSLILPQKTSQRVLIEELPDEHQDTKTDTPENESESNDNSRLSTEESRVFPDNSRLSTEDSRGSTEDSRISSEDIRLSTKDSRESHDNSRMSSDSGISIDIIQKLAEQVGSTVIEREPLNIEEKAREFKQKTGVDLEDIDD